MSAASFYAAIVMRNCHALQSSCAAPVTCRDSRCASGDAWGPVQLFRDYYFEQRHLQLMSDLTPPVSMLEHHRAFLTHIAGFFIVEEKIMQSTAGLMSPDRMATLWAAAVSAVRTCMDSGFMETDNTASMLVMKDYIFLTVSALSQHRFDTSAITVRPAACMPCMHTCGRDSPQPARCSCA
jgi:hypothetical protein